MRGTPQAVEGRSAGRQPPEREGARGLGRGARGTYPEQRRAEPSRAERRAQPRATPANLGRRGRPRGLSNARAPGQDAPPGGGGGGGVRAPGRTHTSARAGRGRPDRGEREPGAGRGGGRAETRARSLPRGGRSGERPGRARLHSGLKGPVPAPHGTRGLPREDPHPAPTPPSGAQLQFQDQKVRFRDPRPPCSAHESPVSPPKGQGAPVPARIPASGRDPLLHRPLPVLALRSRTEGDDLAATGPNLRVGEGRGPPVPGRLGALPQRPRRAPTGCPIDASSPAPAQKLARPRGESEGREEKATHLTPGRRQPRAVLGRFEAERRPRRGSS
ncbi:collagen alpha-2(I) chain-like [Sarcophilus harrisii]|uniref:collagen alpha-2(I) chain-like n=1 Tax=Sarcophilus harrisii TaxID=9305 RepID=UPI001301F913|nr:collagen alpha-2(I) chain-like [Sarcophilus harrisii]